MRERRTLPPHLRERAGEAGDTFAAAESVPGEKTNEN